MSDSRNIFIAIVVAIILIAAGGYLIMKPDSKNLNLDTYHTITSKDTVTLYKNEGLWKVYYDNEFDVYCWVYDNSIGSCKTSAELGIRKR